MILFLELLRFIIKSDNVLKYITYIFTKIEQLAAKDTKKEDQKFSKLYKAI